MTTDIPPLITVDDALASVHPLLELRAHALNAARALVPASVLVFLALTRRRMIRDAVVLECQPLSAPLDAMWRRYMAEVRSRDPFASGRLLSGPAVAALADVDVDPAYAAFLREWGIGDQAALYLRVAGTPAGVLAIMRSVRQPRFTRAELVTLRRLQSLLQHAYVAAVAPATGTTRDLLRARGLSEREADVAELVCRGATNAEVGRTLHLSEATVKTHLSRVYAKLGVSSRTQLAIHLGGPLRAPDDSDAPR